MLRCASLVFVSLTVGCSSSNGDATTDDAGANDSAPALDTTPANDAAGDVRSDVSHVEANPCATSHVGCDAYGTFYPEIRAYYDAHDGKAQLGDPHDNG